MMMICLFGVSLISCEKQEDVKSINCENFVEGLTNEDDEVIEKELAEILEEMQSVPTDDDPFGHEANFNKILNYIRECSELTAKIDCYACIETLPVQTEIIITIGSDTENVFILDFYTPEDDKISYNRMHR